MDQPVPAQETSVGAGAPHQALLLPAETYPDAGHSFLNFGSRRATTDALGTDGLLVCGTTGEAATMSEEEYSLTVRTVVEAASNYLPVVLYNVPGRTGSTTPVSVISSWRRWRTSWR